MDLKGQMVCGLKLVAFRGDRVIVGDKAREYISKDAGNVFGGFKRKMGSGESFLVPATTQFVTPIQLSAAVLKELKNFVHTGEGVSAAVITIPASFDTIQSNATKKAGYEAGFGEVVLLQEPIAASLAYFNDSKQAIPETGNWLVYDLGGGTFDVALVSIINGELRVTDHEGNNFLGGMDFDALLIEKLIVPEIIKRTGDAAIEEKMRNRDGGLEKLWYVLLHKAEEAKKELSGQAETEIEFNLPGSEEEVYVRITRDDFNAIIHDRIASTTELIQTILKRNNLSASAVNNIIMVGGSTYIPYVRELLSRQVGIPLAFDTDPTTAIAVGAAYYAGSKLSTVKEEESKIENEIEIKQRPDTSRRVKAVFQSVSSEEEELYMAMPEEGDFSDLFYRITRDDGGYDSGTKKVEKRISEFLSLQKGCMNRFSIRFFDAQNNPVAVQHPPIDIMQGKFNVAGQPLPADICLEVDDPENNSTKLQIIFERNDILPLKKTIYKEISRTIKKGSADEIVISVLEGTRHSRPHSNLVIGLIEIKASELKTDLVKGSDIELKFEMNESRDLTITAFAAMSEQEFKGVFNTSEKQVSVARLRDDINGLVREMRREMQDEKARDDDEENEWMQDLRQCIIEGEKLQKRLEKMKETDLTDAKYEISEARRKLSSKYDALGKDQRIFTLQADYFNHKTYIEDALPHVELDRDKLANDFDRIVQDEAQFLKAKSPAVLRAKIDALELLRRRVYANTKHIIMDFFLHFASQPVNSYSKPSLAATLIKQGEEAMANEQFGQLRTATLHLSHLLYGEEPEKFQLDESVLHFVFSESWQKAVNALPSSFATMRDDVVEQVIGVVLRFQHKATWYYLHRVLQDLRKIETNDYNRSEIERIDKVMHGNSQVEGNRRSTPSSGGEVSTGRMIWWGIWLVLIIIRVATCSNRNSSTNDYLQNIRASDYSVQRADLNYILEKENEARFTSFLDSLCTAGTTAVKPSEMETGDQPFVGLAESPDMARNDSVTITNNTGHDAVLLYCKDIPGHRASGFLPKMYATFIKRGESEVVSVEPNNGRLYFAFGDGWGQLKETVQVQMGLGNLAMVDSKENIDRFVMLSHFFVKPATQTQTLLQSPLKISYAVNTGKPLMPGRMVKVNLYAGEDGFSVTTNAAFGGRLTVEREE